MPAAALEQGTGPPALGVVADTAEWSGRRPCAVRRHPFNHVHRPARLGPSVVITETWYKAGHGLMSADRGLRNHQHRPAGASRRDDGVDIAAARSSRCALTMVPSVPGPGFAFDHRLACFHGLAAHEPAFNRQSQDGAFQHRQLSGRRTAH